MCQSQTLPDRQDPAPTSTSVRGVQIHIETVHVQAFEAAEVTATNVESSALPRRRRRERGSNALGFGSPTRGYAWRGGGKRQLAFAACRASSPRRSPPSSTYPRLAACRFSERRLHSLSRPSVGLGFRPGEESGSRRPLWPLRPWQTRPIVRVPSGRVRGVWCATRDYKAGFRHARAADREVRLAGDCLAFVRSNVARFALGIPTCGPSARIFGVAFLRPVVLQWRAGASSNSASSADCSPELFPEVSAVESRVESMALLAEGLAVR